MRNKALSIVEKLYRDYNNIPPEVFAENLLANLEQEELISFRMDLGSLEYGDYLIDKNKQIYQFGEFGFRNLMNGKYDPCPEMSLELKKIQDLTPVINELFNFVYEKRRYG